MTIISRSHTGEIAQWLERLPAMQKVPGLNPSCAAWIWVYYSCGSAKSSARDVEQGCRLCMHACKSMHGRKRTWMTKRKSRGPETGRYHAPTHCPPKSEMGWLQQMSAVRKKNDEPTRNPNKGNATTTTTTTTDRMKLIAKMQHSTGY